MARSLVGSNVRAVLIQNGKASGSEAFDEIGLLASRHFQASERLLVRPRHTGPNRNVRPNRSGHLLHMSRPTKANLDDGIAMPGTHRQQGKNQPPEMIAGSPGFKDRGMGREHMRNCVFAGCFAHTATDGDKGGAKEKPSPQTRHK